MSSTASLLRVSGIVPQSIVDGPGLRYVIFTQGCPHACPGCHNPQTHPYDGGSLMDADRLVGEFCKNPLLAGVTFSGGEPFLQPEPLIGIAKRIRALNKTVMIYTGYTLEQLYDMSLADSLALGLLECADILVDGPYIEALRDLELPFRGSSNQRLLYRAGGENGLPLFSDTES